MPEEPSTNGTTTPPTSKFGGLALTEYSAAPTPPSERADCKLPGVGRKCAVPEDFLLPNGYPDVRYSFGFVYSKLTHVSNSTSD